MIALAPSEKGASRLIQLEPDRLAEVSHAAARARTEACAMISIWISPPPAFSSPAPAFYVQSLDIGVPHVPDAGVIIVSGLDNGDTHFGGSFETGRSITERGPQT
jgi:hypothetical protein